MRKALLGLFLASLGLCVFCLVMGSEGSTEAHKGMLIDTAWFALLVMFSGVLLVCQPNKLN